jgi:hypothetical protein
MDTQSGSPDHTPPSLASGMNIDFAWIARRAKEVILLPEETWSVIKREQDSIADIYRKYVVPLAGAGAIAGFLGMVLFGTTLPFIGTVSAPFFRTLVSEAIAFGLQLVMIYALAFWAQKAAGMCEGNATVDDSFRLLAYSFTPSYVAALFGIFPLIGTIAALFGLYSLYVLWTGITIMTAVPEARRWKFLALLILGGIVAGIAIAIVMMIFAPMPH